jgi:hypothetical protein
MRSAALGSCRAASAGCPPPWTLAPRRISANIAKLPEHRRTYMPSDRGNLEGASLGRLTDDMQAGPTYPHYHIANAELQRRLAEWQRKIASNESSEMQDAKAFDSARAEERDRRRRTRDPRRNYFLKLPVDTNSPVAAACHFLILWDAHHYPGIDRGLRQRVNRLKPCRYSCPCVNELTGRMLAMKIDGRCVPKSIGIGSVRLDRLNIRARDTMLSQYMRFAPQRRHFVFHVAYVQRSRGGKAGSTSRSALCRDRPSAIRAIPPPRFSSSRSR